MDRRRRRWAGDRESGGFSFLPDQDGKILIRKNRADYPAGKDRPAFSHTDLMIVYKESGEAKLRAIYFDMGGSRHPLHCRAIGPMGNSVQFVSREFSPDLSQGRSGQPGAEV